MDSRSSAPGLVFIGSHLGYPMDRTPLGGGAMVGLHLARLWSAAGRCRLAFLGSGPEHPVPSAARAAYVRLAGDDNGLVDLSELAYARFCRAFERQATRWLLARPSEWPPESTCVVVNDLSEGPDLAALKAAGYPVVSVWHVDVVDYFNKLYCGGLVGPAKAAGLYEALRSARLSAAVPDVLRLVFEKQRQTVKHSDLIVLPSRAMAETIQRCYAPLLQARKEGASPFFIQPWGAIGEKADPDARRAAALKAHYQIGPETATLLTLSRISPEKGVDLLLKALLRLEQEARLPRDVVLLICGEAAFMQGHSYLRRVRRLASKLIRARCFFPGYLSAAEKPAFFSLANLFVSPSIHESYGLTIVEAMRAGLPILASDHYGVRDILDASCGRRVPYPSLKEAPRVLAGALSDMLADPAGLADMGRRAASSAAAMRFDGAAGAILDAALGLLKAPSEARR